MVRYHYLLHYNEIGKMNILFLTMSTKVLKIEDHEIYNDLMRKFVAEGHNVFVMLPFERRTGRKTELFKSGSITFLGVKTLNVQKTNVLEKGIGQVLLENQFKSALKKFLSSVKFDVILYSTPPITFTKVIKCAKEMNPQALTYLMLKDIFPQNAVDLGMLSKNGLKSILYRSFRKKEKEMYSVSDFIGCMSPANVKYVIAHNPEVDPAKVEICPNSCEVTAESFAESLQQKVAIREKYNLPVDKPILIYGGNLGKPQGIPFLIECLEANKNRTDCHFLVVGDGFEYPRLQAWYENNRSKAVTVIRRLPKADYDQLADACDIGLIFLDYRFTIPNYPSRLLPYLMGKKPVLACTDPNCDTGTLAAENGYGVWAPSNDVEAFTHAVDKLLKENLQEMGENGYQFFLNNYTVSHTYHAIMQHIK